MSMRKKPIVPSSAATPVTKAVATAGRKSIRSIMQGIVGQHSTEIEQQIKQGLLHKSSRVAFKYLTLVTAYVDGKPVETHRMVALDEGPEGAYDLSKLSPQEQDELLILLRRSKDVTGPSSTI